MRTLLCALVPLLLFFTCVEMQASIYGILSGKVRDDQGNPLVGATVRIEGTTRGGYTKADGSFTILKINAGTYNVRVSSLGFKDYVAQVRINADSTTQLNVTLSPDNKRTDAIVVNGSAVTDPEKIGSVRGISNEQLTIIPIESVQSVVSRQGCGMNSFNIRSCYPTQFRINGLDVNDQFEGGIGQTPITYYPTSPNAATEEVQVISGGFSAEHSSALNSVANAVQRDNTSVVRYVQPVFVNTTSDRFSTFGMDVDNASYTLARDYLRHKQLPPQEIIRPEEFLNYFDYGYAAPCEDEFAVYMECAPSMFASDNTHLLKIGIKARELYNDERSAAVLTFVIDMSGSMSDELPMIQKTLSTLVKKLRPDDIVSIVTFGSEAAVHLKPTSIEHRNTILESIATLRITGSTNVGAEMKLGYDMAEAGFDAHKINRVIFLGDGVANNGLTSSDSILATVSKSAERGIALTMIGMGMNTYNDRLMEELANRGDGKYFYIDTERELNAIVGNNFVGLLDDVARDAKIQVEFNPLVVEHYRLIGYENRTIADSLFRDDTQDAGEVGAGHTVTALYEIKLRPESEGKLARVALRYFAGRSTTVREIQEDISTAHILPSYDVAGYSFKLAAVSATFAEYLRGVYREGRNTSRLVDCAREIAELSGGLPEVGELRDNIIETTLIRTTDAQKKNEH